MSWVYYSTRPGTAIIYIYIYICTAVAIAGQVLIGANPMNSVDVFLSNEFWFGLVSIGSFSILNSKGVSRIPVFKKAPRQQQAALLILRGRQEHCAKD